MFECILVGDTGSGNNDQYLVSKSMEKLIAKNPKIQSVMIVGDNIYPNGSDSVDDEQFVTKFQDPYKNIVLPFYLCLGNHDYGTKGNDFSDTQIKYTSSKHNTDKKWNMPRKWYSQQFPHCEFFFIDTNFDRLSEFVIQKQLRDTVQGIRNSKQKWKVLCGHHTWRSVGGHGNASSEPSQAAENKFETFMNDILNQVKIDLYVCGHDHCKSIIKVGSHKTLTLVIGTGGKSYDENLFYPQNMNPDNSILEFFSPNLGVCHMKCKKDSLILTCYNENLEKEYTYRIKK
jgi:tartrate-resistant acid phosphatase type 5